MLVKDRCQGQRLEFFAHSLQTHSLDHPSMQGCFIGILGKDFPASENQILKVSKRYKLFNKRRIVVCPFAQTNGSILRDGTHGPAQPFFDQFHTGDQCGANSSPIPEVLPTSPWRALSSPALVPWLTSSRCMTGTINGAVYQEVLYLCLPRITGAAPSSFPWGIRKTAPAKKVPLRPGEERDLHTPL